MFWDKWFVDQKKESGVKEIVENGMDTLYDLTLTNLAEAFRRMGDVMLTAEEVSRMILSLRNKHKEEEETTIER